MRETEVKYKYESIGREALIQRCIEKGFRKIAEVQEIDKYYTLEGKDFFREDKALRLRQICDCSDEIVKWKITYKGPNMSAGGQDREELETDVQNGTVMEELLERIGCHIVAEIDKYRIYFKRDNVNICVDSVKNLGEYVEIEIIGSEKDGKDMYCMIQGILNEMSFAHVTKELKTYLELILDA